MTMMDAGISVPQCNNAEALEVIRKFAGFAMGANYAYESDKVAEQVIEDYYVKASEQLENISDPDVRENCRYQLDIAACKARNVNDSAIEMTFDCDMEFNRYKSEHAAITGHEHEVETPWYLYVMLGPAAVGFGILYYVPRSIVSPFRSESGATFFDLVFS